MDGFLSKPIRRVPLLAAVQQWTSGTPKPEPAARMAPDTDPATGPSQAMDYEQALKEFENDAPFLLQALEGFVAHVTGQLEALPGMIARNELATAREEAHSIKGGAGNLVAHDLSRAALALQLACETERPQTAQKALDQLTEEFSRFKKYVSAFSRV